VSTRGVDHFTCYGARPSTRRQFVPVEVTVTDQFAERVPFVVKKPIALCAPTNKDGEDPTAPHHRGHLVCYRVARAQGSLLIPPPTIVSVHNANFGGAGKFTSCSVPYFENGALDHFDPCSFYALLPD